MKSRLGRFVLGASFIGMHAKEARLIMGRLIVLDAKFDPLIGAYVYLAESPEFDEVDLVDVPPLYDLVVQDDVFEYRFVRQQDDG